MVSDSAPQGTLQTALTHAYRLLGKPPLAEAQAREILAVFPNHPDAMLLLAISLRLQRRLDDAQGILQNIASTHPDTAPVLFEQALIALERDDATAAIDALTRVVQSQPRHPHAWQVLGDCYTLTGNATAAADAYVQHVKTSSADPTLMHAATALSEGKLDVAEHSLRAILKERPTDIAAIRMLAEVGGRLARYDEALALLERALDLAPDFEAARHHYAILLHRHGRPQAGLEQIEHLLRRHPQNAAYRMLEASILARLGEHTRAIAAYRSVLTAHPNQAKAWMSLGHTLKAAGDKGECITAYRRAIEIEPTLGEAYWSLANLKTFRFEEAEVRAMRTALARQDLGDDDRLHMHFALGKALEDAGIYEESFGEYEKGNAVRRAQIDYSAADTEALCTRLKETFAAPFIARLGTIGCNAADPIFVVGLPRSGSTLIEQILASHSAVEGTMELPDILAMARRLGGKDTRIEVSQYPQCLSALRDADFAALGQEYLARTRVQRKTDKPFFIDKMPNNFLHVGFIKAILPNAKIVDVRRHPLGCCFSGYKQHFARGQGFSYSLTDIGRYYRAYVDLMEHYDSVLPGAVARVRYEDVVADPEGEIRKLLEYCGLPFEEGCLHFYKNPRAVRTASAEQVRQPIYTDGVEHWRAFEPWLTPLKDALGPVLGSCA